MNADDHFWKRIVCWLGRRSRSAVSLELAIVAIPFFTLFLGAMEVAYDLYVQEAMDMMVQTIGSKVWTGQIQGTMSSQQFVTNNICPTAFSALLNCNLITINVVAAPGGDYWNSIDLTYKTGGAFNVANWSVKTGCARTRTLFQAVYAGPTFVGGLIPAFALTMNGGLIHATYASIGFVGQSIVATTGC